MKRNLENLYIPANRAKNEKFREGYDDIKWGKPRVIRNEKLDNGDPDYIDYPESMKPILGHFC